MTLSKYCVSGNDFLIFHTFLKKDYSEFAIKYCNRFYGIGADGLVVLLPLSDDNIYYRWDFYNSDGSKANMCGNASRAVSLYAYNNHIAPLKHSFVSDSGIINTSIEEIIDNKQAIVQSKLGKYDIKGTFSETIDGINYTFHNIYMTIPHIICKTSSKEEFNKLSSNIALLSTLRHKHNANVNIAFMENNNIYYCTYERGVEGITQACGTGACAVYVAYQMLDRTINLIPPSKEILQVSHKSDEIYFAGLVSKVCDCILS